MVIFVPACERTLSERAINPAFSGLDGVETQVQKKPRADVSIGSREPDSIVIENKDGSITLIATRPGHVMVHIQRTLARDEKELFTEQVLSEVTKAEYRSRGLDPADAFDTLKAHESDIALLFSRMPFGEASPSVIMSMVDGKTMRLKLTGAGTRDLHWTTMDLVYERGGYRLRWFGR